MPAMARNVGYDVGPDCRRRADYRGYRHEPGAAKLPVQVAVTATNNSTARCSTRSTGTTTDVRRGRPAQQLASTVYTSTGRRRPAAFRVLIRMAAPRAATITMTVSAAGTPGCVGHQQRTRRPRKADDRHGQTIQRLTDVCLFLRLEQRRHIRGCGSALAVGRDRHPTTGARSSVCARGADGAQATGVTTVTVAAQGTPDRWADQHAGPSSAVDRSPLS